MREAERIGSYWKEFNLIVYFDHHCLELCTTAGLLCRRSEIRMHEDKNMSESLFFDVSMAAVNKGMLSALVAEGVGFGTVGVWTRIFQISHDLLL